MWQKLKLAVADDRVFLSTLLILVALASFVLGRYSVGEAGWGGVVALGEARPAAVRMTYTSDDATPENVATSAVVEKVTPRPAEAVSGPGSPSVGAFVASKSGTKYHHESCPGAKQIKPENRLTFTTEAAAKAAGYTRAANCPFFSTP